MVRKLQNNKASNQKPRSSKAKKVVKSVQKMSNGHESPEDDDGVNKTGDTVPKPDKTNPENMEPSTSEEEKIEKDATEQTLDKQVKENKSNITRKRKSPEVSEVKAPVPKTKAKRQKDKTNPENMEPSTSEEGKIEKDATEQTLDKQVKENKSSRKRKSPEVSEVKTPVPKTKSKRQKVLLEIPRLGVIPGKVFVIGENDVGQLGLGEEVTDKEKPALLELPYSIVDIAAGGMHSICLTETGEVITFGCNDEGALGRNTSEEGSEYIPRKVDIPEKVVQVSAGDSHSAALSDSGQVYIWGNFRNMNGPMGLISADVKEAIPARILTKDTIVKIASGSEHLVCLSREGVVYTCGCGEAGQLGRVIEKSSINGGRKGTVLKVTSETSDVVKYLSTFSKDTSETSDVAKYLTDLLTPGEVSMLASSKSVLIDNIWTGSYATFLEAQGTKLIYAFGLNNYNQLGFENECTRFKPKQVESFNSRTWCQISGGQHHSLGLDDNGLVYSLGRKDYGRLGLGENCDEKSVPTLVSHLQKEKCVDIACGNCVSFAVSDKGSVFSWGMGTNHQLGHGDDNDQHVPKLIEGSFFKSWKALKVSGGGQHTLILACPKESSEETK